MSYQAYQVVAFDAEKGTIYSQDIITAPDPTRARDKTVHDLEDDVDLDTVSVVVTPLVSAAYH